MTRTVVGLFDRFDDAQEAVRELLDMGFERGNVSLVANDAEGRYARELGVNPTLEADQNITSGAELGDKNTSSGVASGAGIGAALGGMAGILVGLGAFLIPGIGPILGAGPLIAGLAGAGVGALAGGMVGGLVKAGVPQEDAQHYAEGIRRGGVLVLVYAEEEQASQAIDVINRHNPVDIDERSRGWQESAVKSAEPSSGETFAATQAEQNGEPFAFSRTEQKERAAVSRLDFGPGARSYIQGQPVGDYNRAPTEMDKYVDAYPEEWRMYESRFREDFETRFRTAGGVWEDFRDIYRYGFNTAQHPRYSNAKWEDVRDELRQDFQARYPDNNWERSEDIIRQAWEVGRVPR